MIVKRRQNGARITELMRSPFYLRFIMFEFGPFLRAPVGVSAERFRGELNATRAGGHHAHNKSVDRSPDPAVAYTGHASGGACHLYR